MFLNKNVPWHILAPSAVACDNLHLRASAHLQARSAFLFNRKFHRNFLLNKKTAPTLRHIAEKQMRL